LGIVGSLLFITVTPYTIINALALILYLFYFGISLITTPFIFSGSVKNHTQEDREFTRQFDQAQASSQASSPIDQAKISREEYS